MTILVAEDADLDHSRAIAGEPRLDHIVVDPDISSTVAGIIGCICIDSWRLRVRIPSAQRPAMRPDLVASTALAADACMDYYQRVNIAIIIPGIRNPVRSIVIILSKVDRGIGKLDHLVNKATSIRCACPFATQTVAAVGSLVIGIRIAHLVPAVNRAIYLEVIVGDLLVILLHGPCWPWSIEKLGLKVRYRPVMGAGIREFSAKNR